MKKTKRYIYGTLALIFAYVSIKLGWWFDGQVAISATDQVTRGFDYDKARASMDRWTAIKGCVQVVAGVFGLLFAATFLTKKTK